MKNIPSFIRTRLIPALVITVLAMAAGIWTARLLISHDTGADPLAATRFPTARTVQPFSLVDHTGSPFDNATLAGRWSFLFFGYTHCPDVCPTTLSGFIQGTKRASISSASGDRGTSTRSSTKNGLPANHA